MVFPGVLESASARLKTLRRRKSAADNLPRQSSSRHVPSNDKSHKTTKSKVLRSASLNAAKVDGRSEITIARNDGHNCCCPEKHAQACTPTPTVESSVSKNCFSTKTSKPSDPSSTNPADDSSLASQTTTDNTTVSLQTASKEFIPLSHETPNTSADESLAKASPSDISIFRDHAHSLHVIESSDERLVTVDPPSATRSSSKDRNVPRSKASISSPPVGSTAGADMPTIEAAASGSGSVPPMPANDSVSPPSSTPESIPPSAHTAGFPAPSNDQDQIPSLHCKTIANDCFVELALSFPIKLEQDYDQRIFSPLSDTIRNQLGEDAEVTIECVMARSTSTGIAEPTILLMCSTLNDKRQIGRILKECDYISAHFRQKVVVLENQICASGDFSPEAITVLPNQKFLVEIAADEKGAKAIVFGCLAKFIRDDDAGPPIFSTIGGVISIAGTLYGLTTAHGIHNVSNPHPKTTRFSDFSSIGYVKCSEWSGKDDRHRAESTRDPPTASDWTLVKLRTEGLCFNQFKLPGLPGPQRIDGYIKNRDLSAGEVMVCAGVSGFQRAFLSGKASHSIMAGGVFELRSLSLENTLVSGDSGSWVVRDGKLCGYIFSQLGKGVTWGYMLPIEPVFEAIANYWRHHYCFPEIAQASDSHADDPNSKSAYDKTQDLLLSNSSHKDLKSKPRNGQPSKPKKTAEIAQASDSDADGRDPKSTYDETMKLLSDSLHKVLKSRSRYGQSPEQTKAAVTSSNASLPQTLTPKLTQRPVNDFGPERLDGNVFKRIQHQTHKFFVLGRVFRMFLIENAGETADRPSLGGSNFTILANGEYAYHQFRRFVVVKVIPKELWCYCCPISTYGGQATVKQGVNQKAHTIVYSSDEPPKPLPGEEGLNKDPLQIKLISPDEKLDPKSRLNLGRAHVIDHNFKVENIGMIDERSIPKLLAYRREVLDDQDRG